MKHPDKAVGSYFDLPESEKRKIVMAAGKEAQKMMQKTIDKADKLPPTDKREEWEDSDWEEADYYFKKPKRK